MSTRLPVLLLLAFGLTACPARENPPAAESGGDEHAVSGEDHAAASGEAAGESDEHGSSAEEKDLLHRTDPHGVYGTGITLAETSSLAAILADPAAFEGKTVRVTGEVAEVCPMRGCWIEIADPAGGPTMRVKVKDGDIVFPLSAKGQEVEVEGTVERVELSEEQARNFRQHEADEKGEPFDPASVTGPQVIWRIRGLGAEI